MAAVLVASDLGLEAGLESHPCGDDAGGLTVCGVAAAIMTGVCGCKATPDEDMDKADM